MQVALFSYAARACCRFCSTQLAPPTRRTVAGAQKRVRVPCRRALRHPAQRQGKAAAWSRQPCDQHRAWAVRNLCRANARGLQRQRRTYRQGRSCRVPRAAVPMATRQVPARSPCRYPCARPSYPCPYPAPCPPTSPYSTLRLGLGARRLGTHLARMHNTAFRARIVHEASARDLARPRRGTHRRSLSKRSARGGKVSAHDQAVIGHQHQHRMGGMVGWMVMR